MDDLYVLRKWMIKIKSNYKSAWTWWRKVICNLKCIHGFRQLWFAILTKLLVGLSYKSVSASGIKKSKGSRLMLEKTIIYEIHGRVKNMVWEPITVCLATGWKVGFYGPRVSVLPQSLNMSPECFWLWGDKMVSQTRCNFEKECLGSPEVQEVGQGPPI